MVNEKDLISETLNIDLSS